MAQRFNHRALACGALRALRWRVAAPRIIALAVVGCCLLPRIGWSQEAAVKIKREAVSLRNPKDFNVPLRTRAAKLLELTCPQGGYVRQVNFKTGEKASARTEAVRMDDTASKLKLDRAKAQYTAAKIELKIAEAKKDADQKDLAQARLDAAQAELKLAEFELENLVIRIPFAGEVFGVHVLAGEFVAAGQPLLTIADTATLTVEVPVDRTLVKAGGELDIMVEQTAAKSKVQGVVPPTANFEPLRDMVNSLATAIVVLDNPKGEFYVGQTVYTSLIPQHPFTAVPTSAVKVGTQETGNEGKRTVQVLRQAVVRDIPVQVLTQAGENRIFVAGAFSAGDEIVTESSQPLKDGQQVRPQAAAVAAPAAAAAATTGADF